MADVIYKYGPIEPAFDYMTVRGKPVHVGLQDGKIFVWCINLAEIEEKERKVRLVATGEVYVGPYCGTVVMPSGLVWHLVEVY
jgi:hypothetical protein